MTLQEMTAEWAAKRIDELTAELQAERDRRVEYRQMNQSLNEQVQQLTSECARLRAISRGSYILLQDILEVVDTAAAQGVSRLPEALESRLRDGVEPRDTRAHLSGAAPARTRTDAEQRVLDALRDVPAYELELWESGECSRPRTRAVILAELARREGK